MRARSVAAAALALATLAAAARGVAAPEPCCPRVAPYHIQALAQRMAQRFQALEYRAQDLRGVFQAFQAVHGNVSHRLRYLESEHAQLSAVVGRLDSRLQNLEMKDRQQHDELMLRLGYAPRQPPPPPRQPPPPPRQPPPPPQIYPTRPYYYGRRDALGDSAPEDSGRDVGPIGSEVDSVTRDYTTSSSDQTVSNSSLAEPLSDTNTTADNIVEHIPSNVSTAAANDVDSDDDGNGPPFLIQLPVPDVSELESSSNSPPSAHRPEAPPTVYPSVVPLSHSPIPTSSSAPIPTASPIATSPADDGPKEEAPHVNGPDVGKTNATTPTPLWELEQAATGISLVEAQNEINAEIESDGFAEGDISVYEPADAPDVVESTAVVMNQTDDSVLETLETDPAHGTGDNELGDSKKVGCSEAHVQFVLPSNATDAPLFGGGSPVGSDCVGGSGGCGGAGTADEEMSDAELQKALSELDALLQQQGEAGEEGAAPPPDPEKLLLKRALKLALAALERTSDACLTLVNFTADAFEGLAAAEAT